VKAQILVVDDDPGVRYTLREILENADTAVAEAEDGVAALAFLETGHADLVITDLRMPKLDGMKLLGELIARADPPRVVVLTAHGSERHAVQAMKLGAYDYFAKPFDADLVVQVAERALASVRRDQENEQLRAELLLARHLVFASPAMKQVALLVYRVAPRDVTVLVTGPSGSGKERVADALVAGSPRAAGPFVRMNCAAVPAELAEAELFGHARGAFTGAVKARPGLLREADGGTLLLDELGELSLGTQSKLLRALQERRIRPVGTDAEAAVDVRLLCATNRDLKQEVLAGRFREDLYYRINVVEIRVPSLDQRPEDVPLLVDHFLKRYAEAFGTGPLTVPASVRQRLLAAGYPGNVRELEHAIERLVALSSGGVVDDLSPPAGEDAAGESGFSLKERVEAFERGILVKALRDADGNRSEAARRLGIARVTLLDKLKKYGLE
jgi:two-component system, NtrC family, response regulator HydG